MNKINNEQLLSDVQTLATLILKARDIIKKANNKDDTLGLAMEIIGANLNVGKHHLLCEQSFEGEKSELIAGGMTAASAESKAKLSQLYYDFKRTKQMWEMGEEAIRILKHAGNY